MTLFFIQLMFWTIVGDSIEKQIKFQNILYWKAPFTIFIYAACSRICGASHLLLSIVVFNST